MEIVTGPVPAQSPFIPLDAKIVVGAVAPASPDPIPIVLLPGFEYRMLEWRHPSTHEIHWRLERRKSGRPGKTTSTQLGRSRVYEESLGPLCRRPRRDRLNLHHTWRWECRLGVQVRTVTCRRIKDN